MYSILWKRYRRILQTDDSFGYDLINYDFKMEFQLSKKLGLHMTCSDWYRNRKKIFKILGFLRWYTKAKLKAQCVTLLKNCWSRETIWKFSRTRMRLLKYDKTLRWNEVKLKLNLGTIIYFLYMTENFVWETCRNSVIIEKRF